MDTFIIVMIVILGLFALSIFIFMAQAEGAGLVWRAINTAGSSLFDIANVAFTSCSNGNVLQYQTSNSTWICASTVNSLTGTANNVTVSASTGTVTLNTGSNVVVTGGNDQTIAKNLGFGSDPADSGRLRMSNADILGFESSPAGTDGTITFNSAEEFVITPTTNEVYSFNSTHLDIGTNKLGGTMGCTDGQQLQLSNGEWVCYSPITTLSADVTCTQTASYCTVFTVPLTASSANVIDFNLAADTNTAGVALQFRGRTDDAQATGACTIIAQSTATAQTIDTIAVGTAPADDGNTAWISGANIAQSEKIFCVVEADASSPQNLILELQMETTGTGTVQKGSNYIKNP